MKFCIGSVFFLAVFLGGNVAASFSDESVRRPVFSGQFYPGNVKELRRDIEQYLKQAQSKPASGVRALIVPHAGYPYSGPVAAEAYRLIQGAHYDTVIVIAFSHRTPFSGIFVDTPAFYETPLGRVPVDRPLAEEIKAFNPALQDYPRGVFEEHSLEVQVPFLQVVLGAFKLVPVYMGDQTPQNAQILAQAILKAIQGKQILVVFSTDLSHFHPYDEAVRMDRKLIDLFEKGDLAGLTRGIHSGEIEACGFGPLMSAFLIGEAAGWKKPELIRYANSGDVTRMRGEVVGYAALKMIES